MNWGMNSLGSLEAASAGLRDMLKKVNDINSVEAVDKFLESPRVSPKVVTRSEGSLYR